MAEGIGYNDMMRMQSEAVQRVREMQKRAQNAVQKANAQRTGRAPEQLEHKGEALKLNSPTHSARATALPLDYVQNQSAPAFSPQQTQPQGKNSAPPVPPKEIDTSQKQLSGDTDRLLVVALILLLSQEEADELLLMALGYLIM